MSKTLKNDKKNNYRLDMKKHQKTILLNLFIAIFLILPVFAVKAEINKPNLQITIPNLTFSNAGPCADDSNKTCYPWIGEYIIGIYKYAIGIVGILATVILMFSGILWINARGNQEKISEAKAWIGAALSGLVLTLASFLILNIINPALIQPTPIAVRSVSKAPTATSSSSKIQPCQNCIKTSLATRGTNPEAMVNKDLETSLRRGFSKSASEGINLVITELWPPTTETHQNPCHYIGTCVDVALENRSIVPSDVAKAAYALYSEGTTGQKVVYETNEDCAQYTTAFSSRGIGTSVECRSYSHITGPHFSVYK